MPVSGVFSRVLGAFVTAAITPAKAGFWLGVGGVKEGLFGRTINNALVLGSLYIGVEPGVSWNIGKATTGNTVERFGW